MLTFRNDPVPNRFEPYVNEVRRTSNCYSDYVPWTDTEDELGLQQQQRRRGAPSGFLSTFRPPPTTAGVPLAVTLDIHSQPLSPSMITSPILIPPPSSPPLIGSSGVSGSTPGVLRNGLIPPPVNEQAFISPDPPAPPPLPAMTPEEIQKDVDTILKTMGLSDDENVHQVPDEILPSPPLEM